MDKHANFYSTITLLLLSFVVLNAVFVPIIFNAPLPSTYSSITLPVQKVNSPVYDSVKPYTNEYTCLVNNLFYEARNQTSMGMKMVGIVTMNRVRSARFPDTICEVVHQEYKGVCQFSWACQPPQKIRKGDFAVWDTIIEVAGEAIVAPEELYTKYRQLYYHADYVQPKWSEGIEFLAIGDHRFLNYTN